MSAFVPTTDMAKDLAKNIATDSTKVFLGDVAAQFANASFETFMGTIGVGSSDAVMDALNMINRKLDELLKGQAEIKGKLDDIEKQINFVRSALKTDEVEMRFNNWLERLQALTQVSSLSVSGKTELTSLMNDIKEHCINDLVTYHTVLSKKGANASDGGVAEPIITMWLDKNEGELAKSNRLLSIQSFVNNRVRPYLAQLQLIQETGLMFLAMVHTSKEVEDNLYYVWRRKVDKYLDLQLQVAASHRTYQAYFYFTQLVVAQPTICITAASKKNEDVMVGTVLSAPGERARIVMVNPNDYNGNRGWKLHRAWNGGDTPETCDLYHLEMVNGVNTTNNWLTFNGDEYQTYVCDPNEPGREVRENWLFCPLRFVPDFSLPVGKTGVPVFKLYHVGNNNAYAVLFNTITRADPNGLYCVRRL